MRRGAAIVLALALAGALVVLLVGRGGGDGDAEPVAHVDGEAITKGQLDGVVEHFRLEAKREGRPFPSEDSTAFRRIRSRLLGLLVYRTELRSAARRLGVRVTRVEVLRRLGAPGGEEGTGRDAFEYGSAESQLLYEAIFRKVTRDVRAASAAKLAARRNAAMARYVARLRRGAKVRYEPGYAPGS